ncbi:hypothetical protein [Haloarchaeobius sp. HME9146]|uniref:hypothetical protein n=1 Tax=Haloarchaeobius sp. HME9146 TaxID=2978732 RepID=UPI0021C246F4|nr:hypothetical protein [Haloarchaeobius sp. HME9146]MCT9095704.1 hypothetical protein [Haloarchaeobius sp. HME9146]
MRRRRLVQAVTAGLAASVAGCSDLEADLRGQTETSNGGVAIEPNDDDPPRAVLPKPPGYLDITELRSTGSSIGANAGQLATYEGDGDSFQVGVFRMENDSQATKLADRIADQGRFYSFDIAARHGVFVIGGGAETGSRESLVSLLIRSDALSRSYLAEHDLMAAE